MVAHYSIVTGKQPGVLGREIKARAWDDITTEMNSIGPMVKTSEKWNQTFQDMRFKLKQKLKLCRQELNGTGGGLSKKKRLSENDNKLVMMLRLSDLEGNQELPESEFPLSKTHPATLNTSNVVVATSGGGVATCRPPAETTPSTPLRDATGQAENPRPIKSGGSVSLISFGGPVRQSQIELESTASSDFLGFEVDESTEETIQENPIPVVVNTQRNCVEINDEMSDEYAKPRKRLNALTSNEMVQETLELSRINVELSKNIVKLLENSINIQNEILSEIKKLTH